MQISDVDLLNLGIKILARFVDVRHPEDLGNDWFSFEYLDNLPRNEVAFRFKNVHNEEDLIETVINADPM